MPSHEHAEDSEQPSTGYAVLPLTHSAALTSPLSSWPNGSSRGGSPRIILRNHAAGFDEVPVRQNGPGLPCHSSQGFFHHSRAGKQRQNRVGRRPCFISNRRVQVLATEATSHIRCTKCANEYTRPGSTYVNDLLYPPFVSGALISNACTKYSLTDEAENPHSGPEIHQTHFLAGS